MLCSVGFFDLYLLPLKNVFYMDIYKFKNDNQAMYYPLDINVIIKSLIQRDQTSNFHKLWSEEIHWKKIKIFKNIIIITFYVIVPSIP
jgi:hypothetical protein